MANTILSTSVIAAVGEIQQTRSETAWVGAGTKTVEDDDDAVTCSLAYNASIGDTQESDYLLIAWSDINTIPVGATILGVTINIKHKTSTASSVSAEELVYAQLASTAVSPATNVVGNDLISSPVELNTSYDTLTLGGEENTWGADLDRDFFTSGNLPGVLLYYQGENINGGANTGTISIDYATIVVSYCTGDGCLDTVASINPVKTDASNNPIADVNSDLVIIPNKEDTHISFTTNISNHQNTTWEFDPIANDVSGFSIRTTRNGANIDSARILRANLTSMNIVLERKNNWRVRVKINDGDWSEWSTIDMTAESRLIGSRHRDQYSVRKKNRGANVNHSNPKYVVRNTPRGVIIVPQEYGSRAKRDL